MFPQYCIDRRRLLRGALAAALPAIAPPASAATARPLVVGGLPVTCNLTLPVACVAKAAANHADNSGAPQFEFSKYSGWPEIKESLMAGRIQAGYMLAPLVMDLANKRIPVKIVSQLPALERLEISAGPLFRHRAIEDRDVAAERDRRRRQGRGDPKRT